MAQYTQNVGGALQFTGGISNRAINMAIGGNMPFIGNAAKHLRQIVGQSILTIKGNAAKTLFVKATGTIQVITSRMVKKVLKNVMGVLPLVGILRKIKYYMKVTLDQILEPLGVQLVGDSRHELMPQTRDSTEQIPGADGEVDFGTRYGMRYLELHVATNDDLSPAEKLQEQRELARKVDAVVGLQSGYRELIFWDDPSVLYEVKYSGRIDFQPRPRWYDFIIPFKVRPFIISAEEHEIIGSGEVTNSGSYKTPLLIEVYGPADNPEITIGSLTIKYNGSIEEGKSLVIDNEKNTARIGSLNVVHFFTGGFFLIPPRSVIPVSSTVENTSFRWRDRYL